MKSRLLFIALFVCSIAFSQNKGTISGIISDKDLNNEALPFASVIIKGTTTGTSTDIDGKYSLNIEEGNHILSISFVGYETLEFPFSIKAGETIQVNKAIGSGSVKLEDIIITNNTNREKETALLLEQKQATVIKQSIGAQEMSRKGVSDVEEGLTKITGITKVGSRGLFVRGLEDRYNNLLINDLAAPTNNPFKKIIPLDLFSTDIVGTIDVYKTFNSNIYGDFAGGTFNIQTSKGSKSITKFNIGVGYTTNNNLEGFLISDDADNTKGFFGFNGKDRELPGILGSVPSAHSFTTDESLRSFSGFDVNKKKSPLNSSIGLLHAEKFSFEKDRIFSYLLSINFDNDYSVRSGADRTFDTQHSGFQYDNDLVKTAYNYKTSVSSLLGLNYATPRMKLALNTLYIRTTENSIQDQEGTLHANLHNQLIRTNQLDKTDYLNMQLLGEYALTENKAQNIKAGISFAKTKYQQPDRKFFEGTKISDDVINLSYTGNNLIRQYLSVDGNYFFSAMAEYSLKFGKEEKQNKLSIGYDGNGSAMESSYRFIQTESNIAAKNTNIYNMDEQIQNDLNDNTAADDYFFFRESSNNTYLAKLNQFTNAGYADLLLKFADKWEINGGIRAESNIKEIKYKPLGSFDEPLKSRNKNNFYFLPSLNIKYGITEKANFRFAASKTYTQPVIMEAFPITYLNADGTSIQGNPLLLNSDNYNADLKFELFPSSKEMFAIGVFGKRIENPIERTYILNATTTTITTFLNSDYANLYGAEAEFILDLKRLNKNFSDFSIGFNGSLMATKVKVSEFYDIQDESGFVTTKPSVETHKSRDLQGASRWMLNSDLKYQFNFNKNWSNTLSLVYAVFGKRIYAVGTNGQDHTFELPYQQLDFVWSSKLSKHIGLKFSADNLLNPARQLQLGSDGTSALLADSSIASSYKKGIGFSLKLDYSF
jgi:outer membrane receptor protein involved in Fe transport